MKKLKTERIISADFWTHTSVWRHATVAAVTTAKSICKCVSADITKTRVCMVLSTRKRRTESKNDQIWKSLQASSSRHLLVFRKINLISHASFCIIWAWRLTHDCTLHWSLQMYFLVYILKTMSITFVLQTYASISCTVNDCRIKKNVMLRKKNMIYT
jgi:hypothetical protein